MKKLYLILIISLFLISFASATTYKQGDVIQITAVCDNCSQMNVTQVIYPNGSLALWGYYPMTKNLTSYNYTFADTKTLGIYRYVTCGDLNGIITCGDTIDRTFAISVSSYSLDSGQAIIYSILLFIFILIMIGGIFVINLLPPSNERDEEGKLISISWLKYLRGSLWFVEYILFVAILFLASSIGLAYLPDPQFGKVLFTLYKTAYILAPVIVIIWIAWIFVKIFQDRQFWNMLQRGMFPGGKM